MDPALLAQIERFIKESDTSIVLLWHDRVSKHVRSSGKLLDGLPHDSVLYRVHALLNNEESEHGRD